MLVPQVQGKSTFIRLMYREEKAKGNLTVAGHDLMKIKIKKFLIYVVKSASFSKTINYYQRKLCMRTWPMRCKLSDGGVKNHGSFRFSRSKHKVRVFQANFLVGNSNGYTPKVLIADEPLGT